MPEITNQPIYSDRYVAFLDILGFSNIVRESVGRPERAAELVKTLNRIADRPSSFEAGDFFRDDFKGQSFSDCIVLSENATSRGLAHLLGVVTTLSIELLANGIMIRGGISKGSLHHSDKVVFGPALIEAYRLESTIARYPRVVVDQKTYQDRLRYLAGGEHWPHARAMLDHGRDGPVFVNVFRAVIPEYGNLDQHERDLLIRCAPSIQRLLDESIHEPKHFDKLNYLAAEWNDNVRNYGPEGLNRVVWPSQRGDLS